MLAVGTVLPVGRAGAAGINLAAAFVQFGPITLVAHRSFFDFYADAINYGPIRGSDTVLNLLAYTATFGGGFSATISLEDGLERRVGIAAYAGVIPAGAIVRANAYTARPSGRCCQPELDAGLGLGAALGCSASGSHGLRSFGCGANPLGTVDNDTKYGFRRAGWSEANLPMLAAGDVFYLQAAYAEGAISYSVTAVPVRARPGVPTAASAKSLVTNADGDHRQCGRVRLSKGFAITAGLPAYWTPTVRQGIYGSYSQMDYRGLLLRGQPGHWRSAWLVQSSARTRSVSART